MFSLPRDTVDVPVPPGPARRVFGPRLRPARSTPVRPTVRNRSDLFPGNEQTARLQRRSRRSSASSTGSTSSTSSRSTSTASRRSSTRSGGVTINVQVPVVDDRYPGDRRQAPAGLHPERHPAHDRRRGAPLRPLAPQLDRLRPRPAPAAGPAVAARAGRPAGPDPAPARARQGAQARRQDRHPGRPARRAARAGLARSTRRTSARTCSRRRSTSSEYAAEPARLHRSSRTSTRSGPRSRTRSRSTRPTRRCARRLAEEAAAVWVLNGTSDRDRADRRSPATSSTRASPRRRRARGPPGAVPANTKIVVYNGAEADLRRHDRLPRADVRGDGRRPTADPAIRDATSSSRSARRHPELDGAAVLAP